MRNGPPLTSFAPRVRKSPYFEATERWGAKAYTAYNHMWLPLWYESAEADYWSLVNDCSLWDVGVQRQVEITGPDAAQFVQMLTPRNLDKCAVNQCKYILMTNERGGCLNDPVLLRLAENHFWISIADSDMIYWTQGLAYNSGLDVNICEPDVSPLQLQGPKSTQVMEAVFGKWIWELKYYWNREVTLGDIPLVISRTGWSSQRGYEIYLRDGSYGNQLWELLIEAGKSFNIAPGAPSTIRRIEGGITSYAADFTEDDTPYHIGLERLVDLEMSHDFVGKSALKEIAHTGVDRKLVGIEIDGDPYTVPNSQWWDASKDGELIGNVRSVTYSPRLKKNIGFAMVQIGYTSPGSLFDVDDLVGPRTVEVVPYPFIIEEK